MPVIPSRVQASPYGTPNPKGRRRPRPLPIVLQKGPIQGLEQTKDRQLNRIQQSIRQATSVAQANPLGSCNVIEGLSLTAGSNVVSHGLQQAWRGAQLTTQTAAITWYFSRMTPDSLNAHQLLVTVSGNVQCTLLVW